MTDRRRPRSGFTLVNLMTTVAVIAILAGMTAVSLAPDDRARVVGAAQMLASDLEYAQALSLADPDRPAVLRVDAAGEGYWIARAETPGTPVETPSGEAYIVILGQEDAATFAGVDLEVVSGATDGWVEFDAFGRLVELSDAVLSVSLNGETRLVRVSASTGFVAITDP
jgi:type II secretory pathway pseudopilin PulG